MPNSLLDKSLLVLFCQRVFIYSICIDLASDISKASSAAPVIDEETLDRIQRLEIEAVQLADSGKLPESLDKLRKALDLCPEYASALNNRAQVFRLLGKTDEAMEDLDMSIKLAYDYGVLSKVGLFTKIRLRSITDALHQAYTQRAVLKESLCDSEGSEKDFQMGAKLGNQVAAKKIAENPYAKLCNAMVAEAMKRELRPM